MTNTSVPTRRRALQALGAMAVLPLCPLASTQAAVGLARESANILWRPAGSSYHHLGREAMQHARPS
jgi:hypothetical protein